jgi:hypothetical protein
MNNELVYDVILRLDPNSAKKVADELKEMENLAGRLKSFDSEAQAAKKAEQAIRAKGNANKQFAKEAQDAARASQTAGIAEENAIKSVTQEIRAQIDAIDLAQRQRRIDASEAIRQYDAIETKLASLDQTNQQVITRQRQLFFASERARNGFVTMSTSLTDLQTNSKGATIALTNIGRIAQDLPFGFIGISNNIDPLLVSFRELRTSMGGTGGAIRAILKLLGGPMGMVFLLGSILPSAILIAQNGIQGFGKKSKESMDKSKESVDTYAESLKSAASSGVGAFVDSFANADQKINALTKALQGFGAVEIPDNTKVLATQEAIVEAMRETVSGQKQFATAVQDATRQLDPASIKQLEMVAQQQELTQAVRDELEQRLAVLKADQAIQKVLKDMGLLEDARAKSRKSAADETERRLQAERESAYIANLRAQSGVVSDMADDAEGFEQFDVQTERIAQTTAETYDRLRLENIKHLRASGDSASLILQEQSIHLANLDRNRLALGLADEEAYQLARKNIMAETESQMTELQRKEMDNRNKLYMMGADMAIASASAVFGETKGLAIAQTIIDTWRGAQGAFAGTPGGIFAKSLAAGVAVATGLANVRKIMTTTRKTRSVSGGDSPSAPSVSAPQQPTFGVVDTNQISASMGGGNMPAPVLILQGDLDSELLAIRVRQGSDQLSSRGVSVVSA